MESIILLVLFGIVSSVIQAVIKNSKQQMKVEAHVQGIKTTVQPITQPTKEVISKSYISMEPIMYKEASQVETKEKVAMQNLKEEPASAQNFIWMDDINYDVLQRSIIMAEVLGKPKALRKAIR